jgi:hypothetical protein
MGARPARVGGSRPVNRYVFHIRKGGKGYGNEIISAMAVVLIAFSADPVLAAEKPNISFI